MISFEVWKKVGIRRKVMGKVAVAVATCAAKGAVIVGTCAAKGSIGGMLLTSPACPEILGEEGAFVGAGGGTRCCGPETLRSLFRAVSSAAGGGGTGTEKIKLGAVCKVLGNGGCTGGGRGRGICGIVTVPGCAAGAEEDSGGTI